MILTNMLRDVTVRTLEFAVGIHRHFSHRPERDLPTDVRVALADELLGEISEVLVREYARASWDAAGILEDDMGPPWDVAVELEEYRRSVQAELDHARVVVELLQEGE